MNTAHFHLVLVHIPIVLTPLAAAILLLNLWRATEAVQKTALMILFVSALSAGAAYLTGEGAEEIVEHLPGILERNIENHEEAAEVSLWLCIVTGLLSAVAVFCFSAAKRFFLLPLATALACFTSISLTYTAYLGGQIRHPEAYDAATSSAQPGVPAHAGKPGDD